MENVTEPAGLPGEDHSEAPRAIDPAVPSGPVRLELERVLQADEALLGEVYRRRLAGESAEEIQVARGAATSGFVWSYERIIKALLEGDLPTAPTVALQVARAFRGLLGRAALSSEAQAVLKQNLIALEARAASEPAREHEDKEARVITSQAEAQAIPGIYVYALPHYLRYPYDEESGRTLFKVAGVIGQSFSDSAIKRERRPCRRTPSCSGSIQRLIRTHWEASANSTNS